MSMFSSGSDRINREYDFFFSGKIGRTSDYLKALSPTHLASHYIKGNNTQLIVAITCCIGQM